MGKFKQMIIDEETSIQSARRFRAAMAILNADKDLKRKVLPFVDFALEQIDWNDLYDESFSLKELATLVWVKAIWYNQVTTARDPFDVAYVMDCDLQNAVLEALAIRWGLMDSFAEEAA